ncbi:MAG: precorrin-6y C5,15-methyltransferase (decarboxylating) subunit CbiE [Deltaproteobacteria bacterium]|nr:precorrin-6y C5,15-methyltransferase (decarboxylating) subunit CbiE [Deltaproteobacteria bacterium]
MLFQNQQKIVKKCSLLVATRRLRDMATDFSVNIQSIAPLEQAITAIRSTLPTGNVAVLASGDPLFYGIGRRLLAEFDKKRIEIHPSLSAIQRACALFKTPWDDAVIVSLHGRQSMHIPGLLLQNEKTIVLTDRNNSPKTIAIKILEYLQAINHSSFTDKISLSVAENIGLQDEKVFSGTLEKTAKTVFSPLNILCLQLSLLQSQGLTSFGLGLTEDEISHSRGLITKNEVRAVTIHKLRLPGQGVLWDIGAGSGSISIEAARANPHLTLYAIEHKEEELNNIKANIRRFGCFNVIPVFGRAPEVLTNLPAPNRVFIGGSSGSLAEIVQLIANQLEPDGRLVINGVIEKTITEAPRYMRDAGFAVSRSVVKVSRTSQNGETQNFNPITIIAGTR